MEIFPAILTDNLETFTSQLKLTETFSDEVDIDVMDGTMFSGKTLPLVEMLEVETGLVRHLHLMVMKPLDLLQMSVDAGVRSVVFHAEADLTGVNFDEMPLDIGLALAPQTPVANIKQYLNTLSVVQIMTVEPGAQGHDFLTDQLKKISELREMGYKGQIKVDGGVNQSTITQLESAGVDSISVGSAIWKSDQPAEAYKALQEILQNN